VALGEAGERTAADLVRDARSIATTLPPAAPGTEVLVLCGDRYAFAACLLAVWSRGHAAALPPNTQPQTADSLHALPSVVALLHDTDAPRGICVRSHLSAERAPEVDTRDALAGIAAERHLVTVFTSGTTGAPRAWVKTAGQLLGEAEMLGGDGPCAGVRRIVATVPPIHIYGLLFGVAVPLVHGAAFVRETPLHAPTVAATRSRFDADALVSVPAHLRGLELLGPGELPRELRVFSSGAELPPATAAMLLSRFGFPVTEILGSSETGGIAVRTRAGDPWRPLPGVRVGAAADGRMLLDSPFVPPEAERPWPCPDRIAVEGDGFRLLGRTDNVIKVASKRVDLDDVQRALLALPGVVDAAVFVQEGAGARGSRLAAVVVAPTWSPRALREALASRFDPVVVPRPIVCVERLPREATGKLRRDRLAEFVRDRARQGEIEGGARPRHFDPRPRADRPLRFDVHVPADLAYFEGHFDGDPILAGVVQLELLVARQVAITWPELARPRGIVRLKFRRPIRGGDDLVLDLERAETERVDFDITRGGEACSSGTLIYDPPRAGGHVPASRPAP
jgi:acyl-coenzyme A synthetase/AMP-(fatty) acid ligase/3-hydroxymyristoyl/3-hydroxydecanoyl-(acyl carrier protein) dehydratase